MKILAVWSTRNPVASNMLMFILIVGGFFSLINMNRELFPEFELDRISVSVPYPGASPEEVERGICIKIEEQIESVDGVKRITSTAAEGRGSVDAELETGVDAARTYDDIRNAVDQIMTFPVDAEKPTIQLRTIRRPAIFLVLYGDIPEHAMRQLGEDIRDELLALDDITQVYLAGVRNYELSIEISEEALRRYDLTFADVARKVTQGSLDLPAGRVKTPQGEVVVRARGQRYTGLEYEEIPVLDLPDGAVVRLGQIARVIDGFEDTDNYVRCQGQRAVVIQVMKTETQDVISVADAVKRYAEERADSLPPGVSILFTQDNSRVVHSRIDLLVRNGLQGLILVFLCLWLFLHLRLAFWVALGIPISFMGAFVFLHYLGATINMMSMFAFIMTLGIVVDDAIIVGENIYSKYFEGLSPHEAAVAGTAEVGWPVTIAILTTIVAFCPLLFVTGVMGKFVAIIPVVVIITLAMSLLEAFLILPAHLAHSMESTEARVHDLRHSWRHRMLEWMIHRVYLPWFLLPAVKFRYLTVTAAFAATAISISMFYSGHLRFVMSPAVEGDNLSANVVFPQGTPVQVTEAAVLRMEAALEQVEEEFSPQLPRNGQGRLVQMALSFVGESSRTGASAGPAGSHVGQVAVELMPSELRGNIKASEMLNRWRELVGPIAGAEQLSYSGARGGPGGMPIEIRLLGDDLDLMRSAAAELKEHLDSYTGVLDIRDNYVPGKPEMRLTARPEAESLGVTLGDIARQARYGFYGAEALRLQRGRFDVKVMVRYPEAERQSRASVEQMFIRTTDGREIPFLEVAQIEYGKGYSTINRVDRRRALIVTADLDETKANAEEILKHMTGEDMGNGMAKEAAMAPGFLNDLVARYPGVNYDLEGRARERRESVNSLMVGFMYALVAIFCLLAAEFRSYVQPIIIMCAIPVALTGAFGGHLIMQTPVTMISMYGMVALAGIVVNDSLILIDFINRRIATGAPVFQSVIESGQARLRPILLTSMTTIAGLMPLLLERSFQAQMLIPMAISIAFGLLASTVLTLMVTPSIYMIMGDLYGLFGKRPAEAEVAIDMEKVDAHISDAGV